MKFPTLVLVICIVVCEQSCGQQIESKSHSEDDVRQFPWQVAVIGDDSFFCGGSLVTRQWVLTAAHCTSGYQLFHLAIGSNQDVRQTTRTLNTHPDYQPDTAQNDLALLHLPKQVPVSGTVDTVRIVPLAPPSPPSLGFSHTNGGMDLILTGWPSLQDKLAIWAGVSSPPLKSIEIREAADTACRALYGEAFSWSKSQICLDTTSSPHVEGVLSLVDGGAPIVFLDSDTKYTQVGILSFGPGYSTLRLPVVATKVVAFLPWIQKVTQIVGNK